MSTKLNENSEEYTYLFGELSTQTKIERYGWEICDSPGELKYINKEKLLVDERYQRTANRNRILNIARNWSWVACGTITVADREGEYYVIDGQHRVIASQSRADISSLPCVVFQVEALRDEAAGWIHANTNRKVPTSQERFRASLVSGDPNAIYLQETFNRLGFKIVNAPTGALQIKSITAPMRILERDREQFDFLMELLHELCADHPITEWLISGLDYLGQDYDLKNERLRKRIIQVGPKALQTAAKEAAAYYARGGAKVWAAGMIKEINLGLRNKIEPKK